MDHVKTKSLDHIEQKMMTMDRDSVRYEILSSAKRFKTSWVELGRSLYSAWKDKLYKKWGYLTFEAYTAKEIGIRKQTALKLLRSYFFLEKEHSTYLRDDYVESTEAATLPGYEAIDILRSAKNRKELDEDDYARLREDVFEKGKEPREVRKDLTALIRQKEELDPEEAREKKKIAVVKRLLGTLKSLHRDIDILKLLPADLLNEIGGLIKKIEAHLK